MYKIMALLIIASAFAHASPKEESTAAPQATRVISEPGLLNTTATLVSAYNQANKETPVTLSRVYDTEFENEFSAGDAIALVTRAGYSSLTGTETWMISIGREVIIPVMNESHPLSSRIAQQGISPVQFAEMVKGNEPIYISSGAGVGSFVADFTDIGPGEIPVSLLKSEGELIELIRTHPEFLGFVRLTAVTDPENGSMVRGICPVPIDMNGNGQLDHAEDIYRTTGELVHGITIGKYPRSLCSKVYAVSVQKPAGQGDLAFLGWLLQDGQEYLSQNGVMALQPHERRSAYRDLMEEPAVLVSVPPEKSATRAILLICGLLILIPPLFLLIVTWITRSSKEPGTTDQPRPAFGPGSLSFPGGLFFDKSHTWTFMEKDGLVRIGLDDFLLHVTGKVTRIDMKRPGEVINKGDLMMNIIQQGKKLEIRSPLSGVLVRRNEHLESNVPCLNESPYSEGWVYLVEPQNWLAEIRGYLMGEKYREWIRDEFVRLKDFFSKGIALVVGGVPSPVIQDGGEINDGILETFGPEVWEEFQRRFINHSG
jgi:glycine cleavage system H lipoate-binding protein